METETPLLAEAIAITEKKVAMALDDIIKQSKRNSSRNKGKRSRRQKNKNQNFNGAANNNTSKVRHYVNSLSAVKQGAVAKRRSNFQGNQYPVTANIAHKAATAPPLSVRGRAFNAGRMTSANQSRLLAPPAQNISVHARFTTKRHEVDQKVENGGGGKRKKTLDSRFASIKQQRKSNNNNNYGVGVHFPRLPPWARATRFTY
ncbi:unnamed protein product [Microthlaspi erraticum]|uniref:Uncharacterized protein n=1 Tax=Microthlaspi erraticum TaxID=1685480 RepID=A0A6D2J763_9BRAS|nr:unnamed protein product [Microthlaspi erraticum]